jgi:uncharacterized repeat protein (TIGR03803 family)
VGNGEGLFMTGKKLFVGLTVVLAIFVTSVLLTGTRAAAQTETVLFNFNNKSAGYAPAAGLIFDAHGNLYGATTGGGANGVYGAVFELSPAEGGGWTEKILHSFNGKDGYAPQFSLIFDSAGNLYGTTLYGGLPTKNCSKGCGIVFELTPTTGGGWKEKVLHNFNGPDGLNPSSGLIFDAAGNLYGMTALGGHGECIYGTGYPPGCGTVFELTPTVSGNWAERRLHDFSNDGQDGTDPYGGLSFDASGNLYGTTSLGGSGYCLGGQIQHDVGCGTVFELTPTVSRGWAENILYNFTGNDVDGQNPNAGVILDAGGNLYGTTFFGGAGGLCLNDIADCGIVYELSPSVGGPWTETVLHSFSLSYTDGENPSGPLIFDASGNLYGTTYAGGAYGFSGTVFELTPAAGGTWNEAILHSFGNPLTDGHYPNAGVIFDAAGNLYGTTAAGGTHDDGTVLEITP